MKKVVTLIVLYCCMSCSLTKISDAPFEKKEINTKFGVVEIIGTFDTSTLDQIPDIPEIKDKFVSGYSAEITIENILNKNDVFYFMDFMQENDIVSLIINYETSNIHLAISRSSNENANKFEVNLFSNGANYLAECLGDFFNKKINCNYEDEKIISKYLSF